MWRLLTLLLLYVHVCWADVKSDHEVKSLPGLEYELNFKHYAGRLNVSKTRRLSYWFVESQGNKDKDPLLLWLNGGPGCSSFYGLIIEHGPFVLATGNGSEIKLKNNPNAWNKFANVLYLEAPAGVGFTQDDDIEHIVYNDNNTAVDNAQFLSAFLDVYPEYKGREFYITGESYAGCYIPTLANQILRVKEKVNLNLKGVAMGNALTIMKYLDIGRAVSAFHGTNQTLVELGHIIREHCPSGFDNLCDGGKQVKRAFDLPELYHNLMKKPLSVEINKFDIYRPCTEGFDCPGIKTEDYFNQVEVQKALHIIPEGGEAQKWSMCNHTRFRKYAYCNDMTEDVTNLIGKDVKVLYFYGESDTVCPFIIGDLFVHKIGKNPNTTVWFVDNVYAGTRTTFDGNLTYTTIADCGHMAALWKPKQTTRVIHHFINNIDDWNTSQ